MYSVSQEMSLDSFQVLQPSNSQSDFRGGQICRMTIPRSVGFFDSHLSRMNFLVSVENANYKMCFVDPVVGVASMIDMIRISQNGTVISEVLEYATLQKCLKTFTRSASALQRDAQHKGIVDYSANDKTGDKALSSDFLLGQALVGDGSNGMTAAQQQMKFSLELDYISLFEILHVFPSMLVGDIIVEFRFVPESVNVLKVLPATALSHPCTALLAGTAMTLTPPFTGFTCLGDSPFVTGMTLRSTSGLNDYAITGLAQEQGTGVITITVGTPISGADIGDTAISIVKGTDGAVLCSSSVAYIVNKVEMALQVVRPPPQYVEQLSAQVMGEGMMIDTDSFTTYRSTILASIKNQTITLPTTQARAKSIFTVPRSQKFGGYSSLGGLETLTITAGGTGYAVAQNVPFTTSGSGVGGVLNITTVAVGVVTGIKIVKIGSGYKPLDATPADTITLTGGGADCILTVTAVFDGSGRLKVDNSDDRYLGGKYLDLLNYRWQINGKYYPTLPIDLKQFLGGYHFAQEHLREMEKAWQVAGEGVTSFVGAKQNFVISRALAKYGASMDLSDRPVNLYLEYANATSPSEGCDTVSFVHHNIRMMITDSGIEVIS